MIAPPRSRVRVRTHRLIASRFPTVGAFDDLTDDPSDLRAAFLLESLTNDRLAAATRRLAVLPDIELVGGPTASLVMAAFLHADPVGGRFTDGRLGAWYAALDVATAIAETVHHSGRRLRLSEGAFPAAIQMRELVARVAGTLVDLRGLAAARPELYDRDDQRAARAFGVALRWPAEGPGADGFVYDSVRRAGGINVCVYRPTCVVLPVAQGDHYEYRWDAAGAVTVVRLTRVDTGSEPLP